MKEDKYLEFKEQVTNTFLKTVSAFANYNGGVIVFGVDDKGNTKGISDVDQACLSIENKINDSIQPQPDYTIEVNRSENTIYLTIEPGAEKPYLYKSKAYKRNSTATIEVDTLEFTRLVLEGKNLSFEELPSSNQDLMFGTLKEKFENVLNVSEFGISTLKTLDLYTEESGYNNAAAILSDNNRFSGIDIVKFGENLSIINNRFTFSNMSIISSYERTIDVFRNNYVFEQIDGAERRTVEKIPEAAFREAIANAIIHRVWDVNSQIKVSMFDDRIEVVSPGGLPSGITENDFLSGRISVLRNRIIANVFYRLRYVEIFGTGIARIKELYKKSVIQPIFDVSDNSISITLPFCGINFDASNDEIAILQALSKTRLYSIGEIEDKVPFSRSKTTYLLKGLIDRGLVEVKGNRRGTKYLLR